MKATDNFKDVIQKYLEHKAYKFPLFKESLSKPDKSIEDCVTYILNTVQNSGRNGFSDEEVFGMAVHYYDEDVIVVGKPIDAKVIINQEVKLTKEEIDQAKQKAIDEVIQKEKDRILSKPKTKKTESEKKEPIINLFG